MSARTKRLTTWGVLLAAMTLAGCNTISGAGQDVKAAGQGVSNGAQAVKNGN